MLYNITTQRRSKYSYEITIMQVHGRETALNYSTRKRKISHLYWNLLKNNDCYIFSEAFWKYSVYLLYHMCVHVCVYTWYIYIYIHTHMVYLSTHI
jgi:hypothetical protein